MADNVAVTAGAGTSVATDDIGGVHYQRMKVTHGADGTATDTSSAAPFPVDLRQVAGASVAVGNGVAAAAQRVTLANDGTGVVGLNAGENQIGKVGGSLAQPASSTLTRPANTTPYTALDNVANNATAASITSPTITVARVAAGSVTIPRLKLRTSATTGMEGVSFRIDLWASAPTFSSGDNVAYAIATGAANFLGSFTGFFRQFADGAVAECTPEYGVPIAAKLASGQAIVATLQTLTDFTPISAQTFIITPDVYQD
jgi:hypothetical protein